MKLIHLLWETFKEWPHEEDGYITQDSDGEVVIWITYPNVSVANHHLIWGNDDGNGKQIVYLETIARDHSTAIITRDMFNAYKQSMNQLAETSSFNNINEKDQWKIYPTQIEVVDEFGEIVFKADVCDSHTATITMKDYLVGNGDVDKLCAMIKKAVAMLELEGNSDGK